MERKIQAKIIKYLKSKGCYVLKTKPGPGVPVGCPDIVFLFEGFWGAIEVKADENSPFQVLQEPTLEKLDNWSWARVVHSGNYSQVLAELDKILS